MPGRSRTKVLNELRKVLCNIGYNDKLLIEDICQKVWPTPAEPLRMYRIADHFEGRLFTSADLGLYLGKTREQARWILSQMRQKCLCERVSMGTYKITR